jgi:alkanesulfonate monooxygenase SsuD/methylene tetrahydromethanopterin reductase-like flavin-dependent oxidoreductase (luciferase family)
MKFGLFAMPAHPPERDLRAGFEWDLQVIRWLDELGYSEAWVGEHHTVPWEPNPAPDILISQAIGQTKSIRLGPGGFLLPFHHPAVLASRISMLDHLSGGRINFGIAASSIPTDQATMGVDGAQTRAMTRESLDLILKLWAAEAPFEHQGKYWKIAAPEPMLDGLFRPFLKPVQAPHPPIGVAGLSPKSDTLRLAGERGFIPMSLNLNAGYLTSHWEAVEEGAKAAGRTADRKDWRIVRNILVADTDAEARRLAVTGCMGRMEEEYALKLVKTFGMTGYLKHDPSVPDADVDVDYMADHNWIVGSPATVAAKIEALYNQVGGFGVLLVLGFDYIEEGPAWRRSLELLVNDVAPRLKHLG